MWYELCIDHVTWEMFILFVAASIVTDILCSGHKYGAWGGKGLPSTDVMYSIRFQSPFIYEMPNVNN